MTDADLANGLGLTEAEAAIVIPRLSPEKRATYERMIQFADDWNLYAAGVGPRPTGALIDTERSMRRRKISRPFVHDKTPRGKERPLGNARSGSRGNG